MKNFYFKVNRRHVALLIVTIVFLHIFFIVRVVYAVFNPLQDIFMPLFPIETPASGGAFTPTPCSSVTNVPGGGQWGLYPYLQFGLDYYIALRDTAVQPRSDLRERLQDGSLPVGANAKVEYIDTIINTAVQNQWNPAFMLSLWLEETGGSHYTLRPYGNAYPWQRHGYSHFGYYPFGPPRPIIDELRWFNAHLGMYDNTRFANFMARFSGGGCIDTNDDGVPDGGTAAYYNNICTMNPFVNNPNFLRNLKSVYNYVVPQGTYGALTVSGQGATATCPTVTSVVTSATPNPGIQTPTPTQGASGGNPSQARNVIADVRSATSLESCYYYNPPVRNCIEVNRSNVSTILAAVPSASERFKGRARYSATNFEYLQCVGGAIALSLETQSIAPLVDHSAACQYTDTTSAHRYYPYTPGGELPRPGDLLIWNSSNGMCDPVSHKYGHMAFVISIINSHNVDVGEASWGRRGNLAVRTVDLDSFYPPKGFLRKL